MDAASPPGKGTSLRSRRFRLLAIGLTAACALAIPSVSGAVSSDFAASPAKALLSGPTQAKGGAHGLVRRAVLMCDFTDTTGEFNKAHFEGLFSKLHDYFDEVSYGEVNLQYTVYDYRDLPGTRADYGVAPADGTPTDLDGIAQDCVNAQDNPATAIDFTQYDGIDLVLGGITGGIFGDAGVGGVNCPLNADDVFTCWPITWVPAHEAGVNDFGDQRNGLALWAHEIGHSPPFNLPHAFGYYWDPMAAPCQGDTVSGHTYFDPTYGCIPVSYLGAMKSSYPYKTDCCGTQHLGLDWIPGARQTDVKSGKSATVNLERIAKPGNSGDLLVRALAKESKPKAWYTAEVRSGVDSSVFDNPENLPYHGDGGVIVTRVTPTCEVGTPPCDFDYDPAQVMGNDIYAHPDNALLTPGEKLKKDGITFKVLSKIGDHGFKVKVVNKS
jgi:hypothetical protein